MVELLFVDPVADLAVLGPPHPAFRDEYDAITEAVPALAIARPTAPGPSIIRARLLALDGCWFECAVKLSGRNLMIVNPTQAITSGMSGSPIVDRNRRGARCGFQFGRPKIFVARPATLPRAQFARMAARLNGGASP
jgi:hypothetical protein